MSKQMRLSPHISLARYFWTQKLSQHPANELTLVDATCGNGWDTLFLAKEGLSLRQGHLYAFDIQEQALENTFAKLKKELSEDVLSKISLLHQSHEDLSPVPKAIDLIVYNLGYLPGGNKNQTTLANSTLKSIEQALILLSASGMITLTCYPGHLEGRDEEKALLSHLSSLDQARFLVSYHNWINQNQAPSLIVIQGRGGLVI